MIRKKKVALAILLVVFALGATLGAVFVVPHRPVPTDAYFDQLERGKVNTDVVETLELVSPLWESAPEDFGCFGNFTHHGFKYSLAFTAYGLASVALIEPSRRADCAEWTDRLIQKMLQYETWKDWKLDGWGDDPFVQNIMWKGHLNLMYALHAHLSGSEKYAEDFHRLSDRIATDMRSSHYSGACCETINYFLQCNTISVFSLTLHDALYGTRYRSELEAPWLAWARENMTDPETGLFYALYHPLSRVPDERLSGYTNAWILTFLHFFDPEWAERLYPSFKRTFVEDRLMWYAWAREKPDGGMDGTATMFAFFLAKEMGDRDLFDKFLNLLSKAGKDEYDSNQPDVGMVEIDVPTCLGIQGPLLFGKTNVGLKRLFESVEPRTPAVSPGG